MRFRTIACLTLAASALPGCQTDAPPPVAAAVAPPPERYSPYTLNKAEIAAVEAGTRSSLKDPDSARFGKMVAGKDSKGEISVCLMVNAKNSYGGYTGETPHFGIFLVNSKPPKFVIAPGSADYPQFRDQAVLKVCSDHGISPI